MSLDIDKPKVFHLNRKDSEKRFTFIIRAFVSLIT